MYRWLILALVLGSCSSGNTPFCDCMKAGEELNEFSQTLFEKEVTPKEAEKMKSLREKKDELCAAYVTMGGQEMLELKKDCETAE